MNKRNKMPDFLALLQARPNAYAVLTGAPGYESIIGSVGFYQTEYGVIVLTMVQGLPTATEPYKTPILAFHIHEGDSCTGSSADPFANAKTHYNPHRQVTPAYPHPYHSGDLSPLFSADGYAFSVMLTARFTTDEIIGKAVIIHSSADDFTTQPSGNAGTKIACGIISKA